MTGYRLAVTAFIGVLCSVFAASALADAGAPIWASTLTGSSGGIAVIVYIHLRKF